MPLYDLLGGRSRDGVMVYGHANGANVAQTVDEVGRYIDMGYKAVRAQSGIPGIEMAYGVGRGQLFYEPADRNGLGHPQISELHSIPVRDLALDLRHRDGFVARCPPPADPH